MKSLIMLLALGCLCFVGGCASPKAVSQMYGHGSKQVFEVDYDTVWHAATGAAMMGDYDLRRVDHEHGYLAVRRAMDANSFGENVGIWVKSIGPKRTEVQVVSRATGPVATSANSRQMKILKNIEILVSA